MSKIKLEGEGYTLNDVKTLRDVLNTLNITKLIAMADASDVFSASDVYTVLDNILSIPKEVNPNVFIITEYTDGTGRYAVDGAVVAPGDVAKASNWVRMGEATPEAYIDAKMVSIRGVEAEVHHVALHLLFNVLRTQFGKEAHVEANTLNT